MTVNQTFSFAILKFLWRTHLSVLTSGAGKSKLDGYDMRCA